MHDPHSLTVNSEAQRNRSDQSLDCNLNLELVTQNSSAVALEGENWMVSTQRKSTKTTGATTSSTETTKLTNKARQSRLETVVPLGDMSMFMLHWEGKTCPRRN